MTDPVRLMDEGATDFERALLDSAAEEMPPATLSKRMMAGLAGAAALGAVSTTSAAAASQASAAAAVSWGSILKWTVGGVAAALLGWGGYVSLNQGDARAGAGAVKPAEAPAVPPSSRSAPEIERQTEEREEQKPLGAPGTVEARPSRSVTPPPSSPPERIAQSTHDAARLREELALLDQARTALKAEEPERALRTVALYEKRFPDGILRQEATVLKVEALKARGRESQADALTEDFLQANPDSAHKTRLKPSSDPSLP